MRAGVVAVIAIDATASTSLSEVQMASIFDTKDDRSAENGKASAPWSG